MLIENSQRNVNYKYPNDTTKRTPFLEPKFGFKIHSTKGIGKLWQKYYIKYYMYINTLLE